MPLCLCLASAKVVLFPETTKVFSEKVIKGVAFGIWACVVTKETYDRKVKKYVHAFRETYNLQTYIFDFG